MAGFKRDEVDRFLEYGIDLKGRTIYMGSVTADANGTEAGIDAFMSEKCIKALYIMDAQDPEGTRPITILLNSPGGEVNHGLAIVDAINLCKSEVSIIGYGMIASMASWIFQSGDNRLLTKNARMLIHYGTTGMEGHSKSLMIHAKEEERTNAIMEEMYLSKIRKIKPDFSKSQLQKLLNFDSILNAEEALDLGLCDRILEGVKND